ncbi:MAG: hypothetical protein F6K10_17215 [Moorea sp. SIO2B7]|nr:hypothetical protein [Moorena sp. SIO2B7]
MNDLLSVSIVTVFLANVKYVTKVYKLASTSGRVYYDQLALVGAGKRQDSSILLILSITTCPDLN